MRLLAMSMLAALGCGRFAFESTPDAVTSRDTSTVCLVPVGHDEDGDAVDDACDLCPHISSASQADTDGDGVGDHCDPTDAIAHKWIRFDPFLTYDTTMPWNDFGVVVPGSDAIVVKGTAAVSGIAMDIVDRQVVIEVGGRALARNGTPAQIAIHLRESAMLVFYAEFYDQGTHSLKLTLNDNGGYSTLAQTPVPTALGAAELSLRLFRNGQSLETRGRWAGTEYSAVAASPLPLVVTDMNVAAQAVDLELDYIAILAQR